MKKYSILICLGIIFSLQKTSTFEFAPYIAVIQPYCTIEHFLQFCTLAVVTKDIIIPCTQKIWSWHKNANSNNTVNALSHDDNPLESLLFRMGIIERNYVLLNESVKELQYKRTDNKEDSKQEPKRPKKRQSQTDWLKTLKSNDVFKEMVFELLKSRLRYIEQSNHELELTIKSMHDNFQKHLGEEMHSLKVDTINPIIMRINALQRLINTSERLKNIQHTVGSLIDDQNLNNLPLYNEVVNKPALISYEIQEEENAKKEIIPSLVNSDDEFNTDDDEFNLEDSDSLLTEGDSFVGSDSDLERKYKALIEKNTAQEKQEDSYHTALAKETGTVHHKLIQPGVYASKS